MDPANEFPLNNDIIYLNHAAVAPWPLRTAHAVSSFAEQNVKLGATHYPDWVKVEYETKKQVCKLINAPHSDDIAFLKNTSEALSVVAYGLDWHSNANIVTSNEEFPSNRIVWESLATQGVELKQVSLHGSTSPEDALIQACDTNTRLLTISSVQYASGLRLDLEKLGEFCKQNNVLFCVDAIQSIGAVDFDVQAYQADFVMADAHKWMLAPEGIALFYCRSDKRDLLALKQFGWHMTDEPGAYTNIKWQIANSARRFECGSPNMLGIHALNASLSLLLEIGMDKVELSLLGKTGYLYDKISQLDNYEMISSIETGRYAGIVTFKHKTRPQNEVFEYLKSHNVICAERGGGIRFSPHFYTPMEVLDRAVDCLADI